MPLMNAEETENQDVVQSNSGTYTWEYKPSAFNTGDFTLPDRTRTNMSAVEQSKNS